MLGKIMKIVGMIARVLLAAGADKWKQGHGLPQGPGGIRVQALSSSPESSSPATIVSPARVEMGAPITTPGPAELPSATPAVVVSVAPVPYSLWLSTKKVLVQLWLVAGATGLTYAIDSLLQPGVLESLGLPAWATSGAIYAGLFILRDKLRHTSSTVG